MAFWRAHASAVGRLQTARTIGTWEEDNEDYGHALEFDNRVDLTPDFEIKVKLINVKVRRTHMSNSGEVKSMKVALTGGVSRCFMAHVGCEDLRGADADKR